jgi:hypothetical protein
MTALLMWTVYDHPTDYPTLFVARCHIVGPDGSKPSDSVITSESLEIVRAMMLEMGLTCLTRDPNDNPKIIETWL